MPVRRFECCVWVMRVEDERMRLSGCILGRRRREILGMILIRCCRLLMLPIVGAGLGGG